MRKIRLFQIIGLILVVAFVTTSAIIIRAKSTEAEVTAHASAATGPQSRNVETEAVNLRPMQIQETALVNDKAQTEIRERINKRYLTRLRSETSENAIKALEKHPKAKTDVRELAVDGIAMLNAVPLDKVANVAAHVDVLSQRVKTSHKDVVEAERKAKEEAKRKAKEEEARKKAAAEKAAREAAAARPAPQQNQNATASGKGKSSNKTKSSSKSKSSGKQKSSAPAKKQPSGMKAKAEAFVRTLPNSGGMRILWNDPRLAGHLGSADIYGSPGGILVNGNKLGNNVSKMNDVIRHEAGHVYQHRLANKLGIGFWDMESQLAPAFGSNAIEKSADCVALRLGASWTHYTKKCGSSAKQAWVSGLIGGYKP